MSENTSSGASQRAIEVARDLLQLVADELRAKGAEHLPVIFHLDSTERLLSRAEAERWIKESVDAGYPDVRHYVEQVDGARVVVNLAAFEDPDYQYYE